MMPETGKTEPQSPPGSEGAPVTLTEALRDYCSPEEFQEAVTFLTKGYHVHPEKARAILASAVVHAVVRPVGEEESLDIQAQIRDAVVEEVKDQLEGEGWKRDGPKPWEPEDDDADPSPEE